MVVDGEIDVVVEALEPIEELMVLVISGDVEALLSQ